MNGSLILLGCSCANDFTSSFIFSSDVSSLERSLLIFISAVGHGGAVIGLDELQLAKTPLTLT